MIRALTFFVALSFSPTLFAQSVEPVAYQLESGSMAVVHLRVLQVNTTTVPWKYDLETSGFPLNSRDIRKAEIFQGSCIQVSRYQTQAVVGVQMAMSSKAFVFCPGLVIERDSNGGDILHNESDADFPAVLNRALIELGVGPRSL